MTSGVDVTSASAYDTARDRLLPGIESALRAFVDRRTAPASYYGMMRYHLGWANAQLEPSAAPTGKRLRPLICLLAAEACAGVDHNAPSVSAATPAAVALELLHNFTLIHDDIEDGDAVRHHRPTVWKLWGEPQAINAGDGMHVLAHLSLMQLEALGVPAPTILSLSARLAETSLIITEGQHLDIAFEQRDDVTPAEYLDMIARKSAALLGCSARAGGEVAGAPPAVLAALERFGVDLGMGFQVRDDILGIWGHSETTGKPAGDLRRRKKTLPTLYAMSRCDPEERAGFTTLFASEPVQDEHVARVMSLLDRHAARAHCEATVERYSSAARAHLSALPPSEATSALQALVDQLETREF